MDDYIEKLRTSDINETSRKIYISRLSQLEDITKHDIDWIIRNPQATITLIKEKISTNPSTIANFATTICKLFTVNPRIQKIYAIHNTNWHKFLVYYRKKEETVYKESEYSEKQSKKLVDWDSVQAKYCQLKDMQHDTYKAHQQWLLLSLMLNMNAKRADLGNIRIYETDPKKQDHNYIYFKPKPHLVLNNYKTSKYRGAIREPLEKVLVDDIQASLNQFPRQFLITDSNGQPYQKNNSYSQYVKRTFGFLFGKDMGVSLWRSVYISANVDFNETSYAELEKNAHFKGHSLSQEFLSYRKKPLIQGAFSKRKKEDQNHAVKCTTVETVA
jgi:hypothetical protein